VRQLQQRLRPPCLQEATIPDTGNSFDTRALHRLAARAGHTQIWQRERNTEL
jgi:hypothetical protein